MTLSYLLPADGMTGTLFGDRSTGSLGPTAGRSVDAGADSTAEFAGPTVPGPEPLPARPA